MRLVVDSSIAVKWLVPEDLSDDADRLLAFDHELVAPDLLLIEAANALWKKRRLGEITEVEADHALTDLANGPLTFRPSGSLAARALTIAHSLAHPVYDCVYLALAEAEGAMVVTADRRFFERASTASWQQRIVWVEHPPQR